LAEAKLHCRVDIADDDTIFTRLIASARQRCERVTGRQLVTAVYRLRLDCFEDPVFGEAEYSLVGWAVRLPKPPLQGVSSIHYMDTAGAQQLLAATRYQVDTDSEPGRVMPAYTDYWPTAREQPGAVTITYVAGYGLATAVPSEIKDRLLACIGYSYEHREEADEQLLDRLFLGLGYGEYV